MIKLCVFCKHCQFEEGYDYSEETQADPSIECFAGETAKHLARDRCAPFSKREFNIWNSVAESCPLFEVDDDL